jgi:hypothetical protein
VGRVTKKTLIKEILALPEALVTFPQIKRLVKLALRGLEGK